MKKEIIERNPDLKPGYYEGREAAQYLRISPRRLPLLRKYGLLKYIKLGRSFIYKREWLDSFMEDYAGYDLTSTEDIMNAAALRAWRLKHE